MVLLNKKEKILIISSGLWFLGEGMLGPLFAIFGEKIGGNVLDISWAWALYLITIGILVILTGRISDQCGKEKMLLAGYILNVLFTFSYLLISKPMHLFFVQMGLGIAAALSIPTWEALFAKNENKKRDGFTWGIAEGVNRIIAGLALILGGFIVTYFSFDVLFVAMGSVQIIATLYIFNIFRK